MKQSYIMVSSITCPTCKTTIFSRATHDYRSCQCKEVAIDGGFEYVKIMFKLTLPKVRKIRVYATRKQLFNDWNKQLDKYGFIAPAE